MGHRANYVLIEAGQVRITYDHWAASRVPDDALLGPRHLPHHMRGGEPDRELMDAVFCEGAILLDVDRRVLLLFGGQATQLEWPNQQAWLRVARLQWRGWDVRWARCGVWDLARYLDPTAPGPESDDTGGLLGVGPDVERFDSVVTVVGEDGSVNDYGCTDWRPMPLLLGPSMFEYLREEEARPLELPDERIDVDDLGGGGLVDVPRREVRYWMSDTAVGWRALLSRKWPGYTIHWEPGGLPAQLAATGRDRRLGDPDWDRLEDAWLNKLLAHPVDLATLVEGLVWDETLAGRHVEADPRALHDRRPALQAEDRQRLRDLLGARLREERLAASRGDPAPARTDPGPRC